MNELEMQAYTRSVSEGEHRKLRIAVARAKNNVTGDGESVTWLAVDGKRVAAIVPADLVEYALRHGWGR